MSSTLIVRDSMVDLRPTKKYQYLYLAMAMMEKYLSELKKVL